MAELIIIYGFLSVFVIIGILFLLQWWFFRKGFYTKYTLHKKAFVRELTGGRLKAPIVSYVCEVDGNEEILVEQSSIGTPFYVPVVGEKVDVYIHPNPQKKISLAMPPNTFTRVFVCEKRALSMSKFYLGMGFAFLGMGVLGIIMYTIARLG